jgi:hypothetical protein
VAAGDDRGVHAHPRCPAGRVERSGLTSVVSAPAVETRREQNDQCRNAADSLASASPPPAPRSGPPQTGLVSGHRLPLFSPALAGLIRTPARPRVSG